MKCPYINKECTELDTSGMDKQTLCQDCDNYNNGVRKTGAMPLLEKIISKFRKKRYKPTEDDIFMMGL